MVTTAIVIRDKTVAVETGLRAPFDIGCNYWESYSGCKWDA